VKAFSPKSSPSALRIEAAAMNQRGFTLIEMLVALAVFAVIAAAGTSVMTYTITESAPLAAASARLDQLQIARVIMRNDFAQIAARPVRGRFGEANGLGLQGGAIPGAENLISFVRRGWSNPGGLETRSSLQAVTYVYEDGELRRISRPMLDPTPETPEEAVTLLRGIEDLHVTFFSNGQWSERWIASSGGHLLPAVIAIDFEMEGYGRLRQLFVTPGAV